MGLLTKEQINAKKDRKTEELYIPEWDGTVLVSEMGADARDEFEQFMAEEREKLEIQEIKGAKAQAKKGHDKEIKYKTKGIYIHIRAPLVAATMVDENGERLYSAQEVAELGKKSGLALDRIFDVANKLNKIYGQERENLEKNSEAPQGDKSDGEQPQPWGIRTRI